MDFVSHNSYLYIDADVCNYMIAHSIEANYENYKDLAESVIEEKINDRIGDIINNCPSAHIWVYLSNKDGSNFRINDSITTEYKGNRKGIEKPYWLNFIYSYIKKEWGAIIAKGCEPDDTIGIQSEIKGREAIAATTDGDFDMLNIDIWNIRTKILSRAGEYLHLSENKKKLIGRGFPHFWAKMLMGDPGDNVLKPVKGRGYGPVGVYEKLQDCKVELDFYNVVWPIYRDNLDNGKDRFLENARLMWIQRYDGEDIRIYLNATYEFKGEDE